MEIFIATIAILISVLIVGIFLQRELFAKFVFLSTISNIVILIIVAFSSYDNCDSFLDIALIYSILSFIPTQSLLRLVIEKKSSNSF